MQPESEKQISSPVKKPVVDKQNQKTNSTSACKLCYRPKAQCICDKITAIDTHIHITILQHPQEKLKLWNSAMLSHLALQNSNIRIGLSWPNLKKATGLDAIPSDWAVLYLKGNHKLPRAFNVFNRREEILIEQPNLKGIVILDGSWKQAHTLWWRNPWLSRLNRIALNLDKVSMRGQAKAAGLSTIESIAYTLPYLNERPEVSQTLINQYQTFIIDPNSPKIS